MSSIIRIVLTKSDKEIAVESSSDDLDSTDFMELIEVLISRAGYPEYDIEEYILDWAADIKSKRDN